MKIKLAETAGFCFGVNRAVNTVYELLEKGKKVCTLGPIIHNPQLVDELREKGVRVINEVEECTQGETLVIRSHGVPKEIIDKAEALSLETIDATCPFVSKIHKIVTEASAKKQPVLIAGDEMHSEVIGIIGHAEGEIYVFSDEKSLEELFQNHPELAEKELCIVSQTTFNREIWKKSEKFL